MESILIQVGVIALSAVGTGVGLATYSYKRGKDLGKMEGRHNLDTCRIECNTAIGQVATATKLNAQSINNNSKRLDRGETHFKELGEKIDSVKEEFNQGIGAISVKIEHIETLINGKKP